MELLAHITVLAWTAAITSTVCGHWQYSVVWMTCRQIMTYHPQSRWQSLRTISTQPASRCVVLRLRYVYVVYISKCHVMHNSLIHAIYTSTQLSFWVYRDQYSVVILSVQRPVLSCHSECTQYTLCSVHRYSMLPTPVFFFSYACH